MKRRPIVTAIILLIASVVWIVGCSQTDDPMSVDGELYTRHQAPDLDDPYGGFNLGDEPPAFGDPALGAEFGEDGAYTDPYESDPTVRDMDRRPGRIFLMITWGNLHRDSTITGGTEWSGSLSVNPGAILLKRTIRFEPSDRILPRTSRSVIEWESKTRGSIDGILVRIFGGTETAATTADAAIDSANVVIAFKTGPLSVSFTLDRLPNLRRVVTLDDGNAVAFTAVHVPPQACPSGFLRGVWRRHAERPGGVFYGKWVSETGLHMGFIKGFYGINKDGERVFFGKWIARSGRFNGLLRGRYGDDAEPGSGWFAGGWIDRDRRVRGRLEGRWNRNDECGGGFFRGVWASDCAERP